MKTSEMTAAEYNAYFGFQLAVARMLAGLHAAAWRHEGQTQKDGIQSPNGQLVIVEYRARAGGGTAFRIGQEGGFTPIRDGVDPQVAVLAAGGYV